MTSTAFITWLALALLLTTLAATPAHGADRITGQVFTTRSEVVAQHGMAATSHPLATQIALDVLKAGGNAVDAAIAANAALGLMEPVSCGIGGDLFAIVWDGHTQRLYALNASGRSPRGLSREKLFTELGERAEIPTFGPLAVSVPGCVDGWAELHARFGRMSWDKLFEPTIKYARDGFPVTEVVAYYWGRARPEQLSQPNFKETFLPGGKAPAKGEVFRNAALAKTLQAIADDGRDAFYKGALADTIDAYCQRVGCYLRKDDLAAHSSTWVQPISTVYRGYEVFELPPNGQGATVLQMLNILEGYDLRSLGRWSPACLHVMLEAKKLAYEDRARFYADPDFAQVPLDWLLSKPYAAQRRQLIDPTRAAKTYPGGALGARAGASGPNAAYGAPTAAQRPDGERGSGGGGDPGAGMAGPDLAAADTKLRDGDTIYLTVADKDHTMVSLIQSNYSGFGSGLCPDGLGFGLQNRGCAFALDPNHPNTYAPGKRPFHTIIPAFVLKDGQPWLSFGVMGGDMQPQGHVQILVNLIDFGMNLQEAGDAPRWYHTGSGEPTGSTMTDGGVVALESGIPDETRRELARLGHRLQQMIGPFGGYQAIRCDSANEVYIGASESRKDGCAAGY